MEASFPAHGHITDRIFDKFHLEVLANPADVWKTGYSVEFQVGRFRGH